MKVKAGRPVGSIALNDVIIRDLKRGLLDGLSIKASCELAGISYPSFLAWRKTAVKWQDIKATQQREIFKYFNAQIEPVFFERERQEAEQREMIFQAQLSRLKSKQIA